MSINFKIIMSYSMLNLNQFLILNFELGLPNFVSVLHWSLFWDATRTVKVLVLYRVKTIRNFTLLEYQIFMFFLGMWQLSTFYTQIMNANIENNLIYFRLVLTT